jgi:NAD(P)-dependent dehydrogenase (short-subunit alcohol dehydrogenase family)
MSTLKIGDATVFVTGANRGLGLAFAREALARGARVYAAARNPADVSLPAATPVRLDVTRPEEALAAARECGDVTLLINNAGIARPGGLLGDASVDDARALLETNFFGPLHVSRAFAPVLARNGGGTILNVLSVVTWIASVRLASYAASKAAAWSLTNALRVELQAQNTRVVALHAGFIDTDLARGFDAAKSSPETIVRTAFDALEAGALEILADDVSRSVHMALTAQPPVYLQARPA